MGAQALYEELYCALGDMENWIREQFSLFADRVSAETMRADQLHLNFRSWAMCGERSAAACISNRVCAGTNI